MVHQQSKNNNSTRNLPQQHIEPQAPAQSLNHGTSQGKGQYSPSLWLSSLQPQVYALLLYVKTSSPIMTKLPVHGTRSRTGSLKKKNDTAADDLQNLVDREKSKMREDKKKKRAIRRKPKKRRRRSRVRRRPTQLRSLHPARTMTMPL